ncbi:MAG: ECF transporter S component [Microbacteriaceae bacterium]|nr:ECF transporter S component [Cryobacterium sp.]MCC6376788.1 ECF transporter S component [Microbacteriaceae bacterium]
MTTGKSIAIHRADQRFALDLGWRSTLTLVLVSTVGVLAFCWPLIMGAGSILQQTALTPLLLALVLVLVLVVGLVTLGDGQIDSKSLAMLGVLAAVGAILRPLSAGSAGIELVFLFLYFGGRVFGAGFGFALGSVTIFVSALLTGGLGPWLPYQMLAASWIGLGAGLLPKKTRGWRETTMLSAYAAISGFLYGQLMNLSFWPFTLGLDTGLSFQAGAPLWQNLSRFAIFSVFSSLGWDLLRAAVLSTLVALLSPTILSALRRTSRRAVYGERDNRNVRSSKNSNEIH